MWATVRWSVNFNKRYRLSLYLLFKSALFEGWTAENVTHQIIQVTDKLNHDIEEHDMISYDSITS